MSTSLLVPPSVVELLLEECEMHAHLNSFGIRPVRERLYRVFSRRVWVGIALVKEGKVRFDTKEKVFYVASSSQPIEYRVTRLSCECPDHVQGKRGRSKNTPLGRCKHLAAAQCVRLLAQTLGDSVLASFATTAPKKEAPVVEETVGCEETAWERGEYSLTPKAEAALSQRAFSAPIFRLPEPLPPLVLDRSFSQLSPYDDLATA